MMSARRIPLPWLSGRLVPAGMLIVAGVAFFKARGFPDAAGGIPGPALVPTVMAGLLAALAVTLAFVAPASAKAEIREPAGEPRGQIGFLLGCICAYAIFMPWLGFISGTALLLFACLKIFGHEGGVRAWAFALGTAFVLWGVFGRLMRVALPEGWLG